MFITDVRVQVPPRAPLFILENLVFSRIFSFSERVDPYFDPLRFCHTVDVLVHSVCALVLHAICDMGIDIKSKGGGLMAEVFLHRLDVMPDFKLFTAKVCRRS